VDWLNRNGFRLNDHKLFDLLLTRTGCNDSDKAEGCQQFDALGHLSLLFLTLFSTHFCAACPSNEDRITER
jgi:hypothetical protein